MENRRTKLLPKIILGQLSVTLLVLLVAFSVLFYAEGYRMRWKPFKVDRAGGIYLVAYPKQSDVYLNGTKKRIKTPFSAMILPGYYNIEVKKDGFNTWTYGTKIESGAVANFKNVVLFKTEPKIIVTSDPRKIDLVNTPIDILANSKKLYQNDNEIWLNNQLLTRFSESIERAILYPDEKHVLYQQGDELRIIDEYGRNDTLLVKLSSSVRTSFALDNKGDELIYFDNGQYYIARIR